MNMKLTIFALALGTARAGTQCPPPVDDNTYCYAMDTQVYSNVGGTNSYQKVTSMDGTTGACSKTSYQYSGSLAPFDEELSIHIRGPFQLKSFAAYAPSSSGNSRRDGLDHQRRHVHAHGRQDHEDVVERSVGDEVTATIDAQVVSWVNEYAGPSPASSPTTAAPQNDTNEAVSVTSTCEETTYSATDQAPITYHTTRTTTLTSTVTLPPQSNIKAAAPAKSAHQTKASSPSRQPSSGAWNRVAYYNADQQSATGLVFLNHQGGSGSGVFDKFGSSLSYASSDGLSGSATSQILNKTVLPSESEVVIMTDKECGPENESCGYYLPGSVAYHGFGGEQKAFMFELMMPSDGTTSTNAYDPENMSALWFLNAQIPRTQQYGECSCWATGCGEFDLLEVLTSGYDKAKTAVHGNQGATPAGYFVRPESAYIKVSVVMANDNFYINVLDSKTEFGKTFNPSSVYSAMNKATADKSASVPVCDLQSGNGCSP